MAPLLSNCKVIKEEPLSPSDAKWTTLKKITYNNAENVTKFWESAVRPTRPSNSLIDAVGIVAILQKPGGSELLLQKQFRPPIDKICVEVPAGLVDEGEDAETCAVRELKEETGYVGKVIKGDLGVTPVMYNGKLDPDKDVTAIAQICCSTDPGFCNTNLQMVHVHVDMSNPDNQNPKPELEENEFIECFSIPLKTLYTECKKLESEGYAIDARVLTLAEGIEVARQFKIT
ncbi:putative ADP-ribose pyrophosphatase [Aureobasidium pullulans]|nr:putative ADP-ribose pyrophosphatase [Aureobasidium pullulans]THZ31233.1 putative ADP-ribose pyrophosphatase [Aureobasidium pullulans]THZ42601.1 putative ADP-ribose pyrophosphatase [Aureobasidium pullulans]THZ73464.1 putative ADP-ribose pyrophosphatase [Aureobasidium pullulans]THZ95288.1 putative ADP-ribose pyrophosphatase [Aureobasidium pullulans]